MSTADLSDKYLFDESKPYVFISSLVYEMKEFRRSLFKIINKDKIHEHLQVYVDERIHDGTNDSSLFTVDRLIEKIDKSELVVIILNRANLKERIAAMYRKDIGLDNRVLVDSGTLINLSDNLGYEDIINHTLVSFWEIELFRVALGNKPTIFLVEHGFSLDENPHLNNFFHAASWLMPKVIVYHNQMELFELIKAATRLENFSTRSGKYVEISLNQLNSTYWSSVYNPQYRNYWSFPKTAITKNEELSRQQKANEFLLNKFPLIQNETDHQKRLSRLWFIYRELFRFHYLIDNYEDYLPHWNKFFETWARSSLWYGLHSEIMSLGALSAFKQMAEVRGRMQKNKKKFNLEEDQYCYPAGSFATAYYSLGKLMLNQQYLIESLKNCRLAFKLTNDKQPSVHTIMGKVYRQIALTNRNKFHYNFYSVYHLHTALKIYEKGFGNEKKLAESQADWGFVLAKSGIAKRKGIRLMTDALDILSDDGFKIRVLRDLSTLFEKGSTKRQDYLYQAEIIALNTNALDQLRQIKELY